MSSFKDTHGEVWSFEIKLRQVEMVKRLCIDKNGKPIDLLSVIETGQLEKLVNDIELLVNVVYVLCSEQVKEQFDLAKYDAENDFVYDAIPEWKTETPIIKASRWFGNRLDGDSIIGLIEAFTEALVNFFPNGSRRTALKKILEKNQELEKIQSEEIILQVDQAFGKILETSSKMMQEKINQTISVESFGNVPVSSE